MNSTLWNFERNTFSFPRGVGDVKYARRHNRWTQDCTKSESFRTQFCKTRIEWARQLQNTFTERATVLQSRQKNNGDERKRRYAGTGPKESASALRNLIFAVIKDLHAAWAGTTVSRKLMLIEWVELHSFMGLSSTFVTLIKSDRRRVRDKIFKTRRVCGLLL